MFLEIVPLSLGALSDFKVILLTVNNRFFQKKMIGADLEITQKCIKKIDFLVPKRQHVF